MWFVDSYSNTLLVTFNNRIYIRNQQVGVARDISALEARSGSSHTQPQSITALGTSRPYGNDTKDLESYKLETLTGDRDIEIRIDVHSQMVLTPYFTSAVLLLS
jgi:hypothetical protein